jgi:hypothetical protein
VKQTGGICKTEASQKPIPLDVHFESAHHLASFFTVPRTRGLGLCQSSNPRAIALLGPSTDAALHCTGRQRGRNHQTNRMAYISAFLFHAAQVKWGADIKVLQELLRHASSRVTLDTYTQAVTPAKRAAQSEVVSQFVRKAIIPAA